MENKEKKFVKRFFTVAEFYDVLGHAVTKTQIYRMIKMGEIPVKKFGTKILISTKWVEDFLGESFGTKSV